MHSNLSPVTSDPLPSIQCETTLPFKLPPVTSDPTPNRQFEVKDKYNKPTDEEGSSVPGKQPPLFHPDEDILGMRDFDMKLQQLKEKMEGGAKKPQEAKHLGRAQGSTADLVQKALLSSASPTPVHAVASYAPPRRPIQVQRPYEAQLAAINAMVAMVIEQLRPDRIGRKQQYERYDPNACFA